MAQLLRHAARVRRWAFSGRPNRIAYTHTNRSSIRMNMLVQPRPDG